MTDGAGEDRAALLAALEWQIDLGADEAIGDDPVNRFAAAEAEQPAVLPGAVSPAAPPRAEAEATAGSASIAAAAATLEDLAEAMRGWHGTGLHLGARNFVFSDGLQGARLMVIGEAPGADEDRQGCPFVGRAGQLLDRMLAAIGLARTATDPATGVYISNILPWRPAANRAPTEAEVAAFLPFMHRHIDLAAPEVILTLGNTPTRALLSTPTGIKRLRGTWGTHAPSGRPVMPSFHPAYLLRQPADKRLAWADLRALRARLGGG